MNSLPLSYRVAQAIGFTGAAWLSGNIAALSMNAAPALLRAHREDHLSAINMAKQWKNLFESGKSQNPPIAALTASAFLYLAWSVRSGSPLFHKAARNSTALYCTAAILTIGIVPYTIITMSSTNNALLAKIKLVSEPSAQASAEIEDLIGKWISLNSVRSLLPLAGSLVAIFAALA